MFLRLTGGESSIGAAGYRCLLLFMMRLCSSFITISAMSLGRALPCHPSLSSAAETAKTQHHFGGRLMLYTVAHCMHERRSDANEKWFVTRELPGMPLPLIVLAMMAVGWWRAWLRALQSSSTLCPSTMMACQLDTHQIIHITLSKLSLCINTDTVSECKGVE